jgi:sulfotransferase famil protein
MHEIDNRRFGEALDSLFASIRQLQQSMREVARYREMYCQDAIFIHINKTAGTAINEALRLRGGHSTALEKRAELGESVWDRKYTFAFVRNPWDRIVSQYYWRKSIDHTSLASSPIDFNAWIVHVLRHHTREYYDFPKLFMPQLDWLSDTNGKILVNFVGRFEKLTEDFQSVCKHLNVMVELPRSRATCHPPYREVYNEESIDLVRSWFRKDIEYFDYVF